MTDAGRLWIRHAQGRYPVDLAPGAVTRLPELLEEVAPGRRVALVTDRNVARAVATPLKVPTLVVPPGEGSKSRTRWRMLTDRLLDLGYGRDGVLVALGGGVVGDLTGFVAATFVRGIPHLQVPTSLLAMVDASVGGKTAVNTRHGKNLVGAFWPPVAVLIDPAVLATLRSPHLRAGLVEALKHGLVADAGYFDWIDAAAERLLARDPEALLALVRRSVELKGLVVEADELERGPRAVLNAGHTVGHAIERVSGWRVGHGEAVAAGLVVEGVLAERLGQAPAGLAELLRRRLRRLGLGVTLPPAGADPALLAAMRHDKKAAGGELRLALPRAPGALLATPPWITAAGEDSVRQALGIARQLLAG